MAGKKSRKLLPSEYSTRVAGVYTRWDFHLVPDPSKRRNLPRALVARLRRQVKSGSKAVGRGPLLVRFLLGLGKMTGRQAWFLPPITLLQSVVPAARFYLSKTLIEIATSVASGKQLDRNRLGLFVLGHVAVTVASRVVDHWASEIQDLVQAKFNLEVKERILRIHCGLEDEDLNSDDVQQILQKVESLRNDGPHYGGFNLLAPLHLARGVVSLATEAAVLSTQINRSNIAILGFSTLFTIFNSFGQSYDNYWWEGIDLSNPAFMRLENIFNIGTSSTLRREVTTLNLQNHLISEFELARAELGSTPTRDLQNRPETSRWEYLFEELLTEDFITYVAFALQSTWSSTIPTLESMSALALLRGGLQGLFYSLRDLKFNFKSFTSDLERIGAFYECQDLEPSSPGGVAYVEAGLGLRGMKLDFKDVSMRYSPGGALVLESISFSVDPGQLVAIVGHNGAGKSSLISLLARSHSRSSGEILVNGVKIEDYARGALQERMSFTFQTSPSLPFTVNEYVGLGSLAHRNDPSRIASALKFAAADDVVATLPDGGLTYPGGVEGSMLDSKWKLPRVVPLPEAEAVPEVDMKPARPRYGRRGRGEEWGQDEEDLSDLDGGEGVRVGGDEEDLEKTGLEEKELSKPARPSSTAKNTYHAQDSEGRMVRIFYPAYSPAPSVLSGGQWQRIALARSNMKQDRNELMVFDEPAASLDPRAEAALFDKILELKGTSTIIFSTHRFNITAKADKILMFSAGRLVEQGTHAELMAIEGGEYRGLWEVQAAGYQTQSPESNSKAVED